MGYNIVTVNVSQTLGAVPSNLQQMSAILSFGSTLQEAGKPVMLVQSSDINDIINIPAGSYKAEMGSSGGATFTLAPEEGRVISRDVGSEIAVTVEGCSPAEWNGRFVATLTAENTLTWTLADSGLNGSPVTLGHFRLEGSDALSTAVDAFFAQGKSVATYLLELGAQTQNQTRAKTASARGKEAATGTVSGEVAALKAYLDEPQKRFYAYLVPESWKGDADFIALARLFTANESMQYFFVPSDTPVDTSYASPYAGIKSLVAVADDTYPDTNAAAAVMWNFVSPSPSEINKVPPMAFRFLQAVNANGAKASILSTMEKQNINYVDTGAEGGISNTLLVKGVTSDGKDMTYWYSVDWVQINVDMALANEVINGSNNPINPLYYNQDGIDRLQQRAQGVFNTGVSYGLVNGQTPVSAVAFKAYVKTNPDDYSTGRYAGLSATYTPMRGFTAITFNINVTMQLS